MTLPFTLPDWLPAWAFLLIALPLLLFAIAFVLMPFNVFGVKSRLETIENQLAELQDDLRLLAMRLPAAGTARAGYAEVEEPPLGAPPQFGRLRAAARAPAPEPDLKAPPIPPEPARYAPPPLAPRARGRQEPKLD